MYPCYFPTNRNLINLVKNTFLAFKILRDEKPDVIISSGAAVAVPSFTSENYLEQRRFILKYLIELINLH